MILGFCILFFLGIIYFFLVKGWLWKILILIFGFIGIKEFMESSFESTKNIGMTVSDSTFSWAVMIAGGIAFLALICTKVE